MERHLAFKEKVAENKRKLEEMGILPKPRVLLICQYCGKRYKRTPDLNWHIWIHEAKFGYWNNGTPTATNIGTCYNCGAFVITPNEGVNYGSIRKLRENGFTGDCAVVLGEKRLYCFGCMKKIGWQWGEKEEEEY